MSITSKKLATKIRIHSLEMIKNGKSSHIGSNLSMTDIIAVLYGEIMNFDSSNPKFKNRDRFIVSKGHAAAGLYAVLAECGFFKLSKLKTFYQDGTNLCGHVTNKDNPGVEFSTGSLGHGLPVAVGMAKAGKLKKKKYKVFCLLSDGECDEGSNWEAILFAAHHKLDNLTVIVDYNKIQSLSTVEKTLALEPFVDKWLSFGWDVREVDGHDHVKLKNAFNEIKNKNKKPLCVLAHTIKGKGVSFMENSVLWHYRHPQGDEYQKALDELKKNKEV